MASYNKDVDYQALINQAVASGDYSAAAQYEQQRNRKIADLDASGTNQYGAKQTNQYSQYLNGGGLTQPSNFTGSSNGVLTHTDTQSSIRDQMNQNSQLWWDAYRSGDKSLMASLEAANKSLAAQLGSGVSFDPHTGYWTGVSDMPAPASPSVDVNLPQWGGFDAAMPTYNGTSSPMPTFTSQYASQIDALLNQILNREEFSYDVENDPLYQQYKKQYNREGTRAMNDTMAAAGINAGGMNSYAMTAAQQANDYYLTKLTDKIPELYQLAYSMWLDDLNNQRADLSMLQTADDTAYGRYRDEVGDWKDNRDFEYGMYRDQVGDWKDDRDFSYGQYRDEVGDYKWNTEFQYGVSRDQLEDQRYDQEWQYGLDRDAVSDQRYENETAYERAMAMLLKGIMPSSDLLAKAGISGVEAAALKSASTTSGSSSAKRSSSSSTSTGYKGSAASSAPQPDYSNPGDPYSGTQYENADKKIYNRNGDTWIYIPGHGRFSFQEVADYVDKGIVKEEEMEDGRLKYTWVR